MIAIVVVAYSRPKETRRLIESIIKGHFDGDNVDLIVSIDKSNCQKEVYDSCKDAEWLNGSYSVIMQEKRLGLRPHILKCGELTAKYDAIILLEDDLVVSPNFYRYTKNALDFYKNDDRIAQISLYSYAVNEFVSRPFSPEKNEYDVYAMRVTQSWGECWSRSMWNNFMASPYYRSSILDKRADLPSNVNNWKENSWKKNFTNYLADSGKYVIYPYYSFTTNYTIAGEHSKMEVPDYHVLMQMGDVHEFKFCSLEDCIKYDLFFERENLNLKIPELESKKYCLDLYGKKTEFGDADVLISTARKKYEVLGEYLLTRKPQEMNLVFPEYGVGIYVYNLKKETDKLPKTNKRNVIRYDVGFINWRSTLSHGIQGAITAFMDRIKKK